MLAAINFGLGIKKERFVCVCVRPSVIRVHVELITDMTCLPTLGMNPFPLKF